MPMTDVPSAAWDRLRTAHKKQSQAAGARCAHCNQPINYQGRKGDPDAYEPDHIKPRSTHPHLALEITNLQPSHSSCNHRRQDKAMGEPTTAWVQAEEWD